MILEDEFSQVGVQDHTITLLNKWCEWRLRSLIKAAWVPAEVNKFIFINFLNKKGEACYRIEVLQGIDSIRSTAPKEFSKMEEVNFTFYSLNQTDQLLIVSYLDPLSEFQDRASWVDYLKMEGVRKNHQNLLVEAILVFQQLLEMKGLVKNMGDNNDVLRGWKQISGYLNVSIPSAMKMAAHSKLPCSVLGGTVITTKKRVDEWIEAQIDTKPYWMEKQKEKQKK